MESTRDTKAGAGFEETDDHNRRCLLMEQQWDFKVLLLKDFLGPLETSRLDSAMTNKKYRPVLLGLLSSGAVSYYGSQDADGCIRGDCMDWLVKRKIPLHHLSCSLVDKNGDIDVTGKMLLKMVTTCGSTLKTLR